MVVDVVGASDKILIVILILNKDYPPGHSLSFSPFWITHLDFTSLLSKLPLYPFLLKKS